ncbi:glycosyltransferase [Mesorhizobium sp. NBSH29]|uniref:glycosyltransferase family 2 protein n=1 Tax=Mesorhizobium sp. NBSH29 TaxID=2654249 RepID=UPI0018968DA6|nr:glycosyltransferase family 2 protein [Mesorhizobium sp. NBSH29]QPC86451.1 glycosyltransferase [Mesorhizobium sp. NBSH29]
MTRTIAIVVPVFNEAEGLQDFLAALNTVCDSISHEYSVTFRYVFVDDGSLDASFARLAAHDFGTRPARIIKLSRNFGKEAALSAGIDAAQDVDAAVLMDADLQHPPEMVREFVRIWLEGRADSVYAYKTTRHEAEGWARAGLSRAFFWVINRGARFRIPQNAGDFRLINRPFMDALRSLPESERFMKGLYGWIGFRQIGLPFTPAARLHGASRFTTLRILAITFDALTSFSTTPLRLMGIAGGVIAGASMLYGIYIIVERLLSSSPPSGIASLLALTAFFGGVQMIFLGLLGEYVGKAVTESKKRPAYIVAEDIDAGMNALRESPAPDTISDQC